MTTPKKQRIIVMNGRKILQTQINNEWEATGTIKKVEEGVRPGIYNIYLAKAPSDKNQYEGKILHVDKESAVFYQLVKKDFIVHRLSAVDVKPVAGKDLVVKYDGEKVTLTQVDVLKKKRTLRI